MTAIAVKAAATPEDMARLACEAERLRLASHPGVVTFVDHQVGEGRAELHTLYAGDSLAKWSGTLTQVAGLAAAVATTLADLHDMGLVHGRIDPTHVLVGADGRPQLCGFSAADPDAEPADDVAGVGHLVEEMASRICTRPPGGGAFGWLAKLRGPLTEQRALGQVVLHATDPDPARRPSAQALARSLLAAVPSAQLPPPGTLAEGIPGSRGSHLAETDFPGPSDDVGRLFTQAFVDQTAVGAEDVFADRPWLDPERERMDSRAEAARARTSPRRAQQRAALARVVAIAGVLSVVGGMVWFLAPAMMAHGPPVSDEASNVGDTPVAGKVDGNVAAASGAADGAPDGCPPVGHDDTVSSTQQIADINGDGCPERITISDGVVQAAGERWAVGEPGDDVALGDWNCDGVVTPGTYRHSTGEVFVFAGWADHDRPLTAEPVGRVEGGVALEAVATLGAGGPGEAGVCDVPAVHLPDGRQRILEVTP
jgi:hypothetical protein